MLKNTDFFFNLLWPFDLNMSCVDIYKRCLDMIFCEFDWLVIDCCHGYRNQVPQTLSCLVLCLRTW